MRIVEFSSWFTLLIDFAAWALLQVSVSFLCLRLPARWFDRDAWLFRTRRFEQGGRFYERVLRIRTWKRYLPDGARFFKKGFRMKRLAPGGGDPAYVTAYLRESRRAELTHYLSILPCVLFFLWNPPLAGWIFVGFALVQNVPCILAQRYNRPRFERLAEGRGKDS